MANISAVLYPGLGFDPSEHRNNVEHCLNKMVEKSWVKEEEGLYRFLSQVERSFEEEVDDSLQLIRTAEISDRIIEIASRYLKDLKKYNHKKLRVFDVNLSIDDQEISKSGHLKLGLYSPFWASQRENPVEDVEYLSLGKEDTVYWIGKIDERFKKKIKRLIALERVLDEWTKRARSTKDLGELDPYRREVATIKDELPQLLESTLRAGTMLFYGNREELKGKDSITDVFHRWMSQLTTQKFPLFDEAAVNISKDEIICAILRWCGGTLPSVYTDLKLVDSTQRNILTNGPVAHAVLSEVNKRGDVNGSEIAKHFDSPPYGWDERVVRITLASLCKNGSIQADPNVENSFVIGRNFRKASFSVGVAPTREEKTKVRKFISEKFGVDAGITTEQISKTLEDSAQKKLGAIHDLTRNEGYYSLPYSKEVGLLEVAFQKLLDKPSPSHRVKALLDPEILDTIENYLSLVQALEEFVDSTRLNIYLKMSKFTETPLDNLVQFDPSLKEEANVFREKLEGKSLLTEWDTIYERFRKLKEKHKRSYIENHKNCQFTVDDNIFSFRQWAKKKQIVDAQVQAVGDSLASFGCDGEKAADYNETTFLCNVCNRTLSTIRSDKTLVQNRLVEEKEGLMLILVEKDEHVFKSNLSSTKWIGSKVELTDVLDAVLEFVNYWLAKGKKVKLKMEGETDSG